MFIIESNYLKKLSSPPPLPPSPFLLPPSLPFFSGNGTFLYFEKSIFRTLAYSNPRHIQNTVKYLRCKVLQNYLTSALFGLSPQKFSLKKFLYFLKRKHFLYFQKWNPILSSPALKIFSEKDRSEKFLIFRKTELKKLFILQKMEFFYIFSKESCSYIS